MAIWKQGILVAALLAAVGCRSADGDDGPAVTGGAGGSTAATGGTTSTGGTGGAGAAGGAAPVDCDAKAAPCASEFGSLFTASNGRADGTLVALVRPVDTQCTLFNNDHAVVQLSMLGQVQRLVVALDGVAVTSVAGPLVGPAFSEGWHPDVFLDYPTDLGAHSTDFTSVTMDEAVQFLCSALDLGEPVSVYAYSDGSAPSSAHQIHRNDNYPDGAIAVHPASAAPTYLLFRYADQVF